MREMTAIIARRSAGARGSAFVLITLIAACSNREFPALAARQLGWLHTALMCFHELDVPGSLPRCVRILIHWNTDKPAEDIVHVYVKDAQRLRPDLSKLPPVDWEELERWIEGQIKSSG